MERWEEREQREYLRAGTIAAAAINPYRDTKHRPEPFTAFDFFNIPRPKRKQQRPTKAELLGKAETFFGGYNDAVQRAEARKKRKSA